ncbi:hypothetical protein EVJ58_g8178 [Rhodofomes roseus]|uniref:Condensation domain-containing protein n=1 Tax=Rhodofomes roseus TaxID=34475 RepID=A0A4Y9XZ82_9APHY|nr:hypothetical protein EVJ58_g8178 [Rhodofomes roseus]
MADNASKSAVDPMVLAMQAHALERSLTTSRPLSASEFSYALGRREGGIGDPSTIISLDCTGGYTIADDEVVLACAALRLRYPLLASNVTFLGGPHFVVNTPATLAHALHAAKAQVDFHTFEDQEKAVIALRDEWLAVDPNAALDIRERTCAFWWGRDADPRSGKYVLGLITTHFVTDNRRRLNLVRRLMDLLASPGRAQAELDAYFAQKTKPIPIPVPTEQLKPQLSADAEEAREAKIAFDELVGQYAKQPRSGITGDVSGLITKELSAHMLRKVWSSEETARILRACKAHGVTITHLVNVAGALSSVHDDVPSSKVATAGHKHDAVLFEFSQPMDLTAKLPQHPGGVASGDMEATIRMELYPVIICVPHSTVADQANPTSVWEVAHQFKKQNDAFVKSPYFWNFLPMYQPLTTEAYHAKLAGQPGLPFMSSLGDLKAILPARYAVQAPSATSGHAGQDGAEIRITENWTAGRIDPLSLAFHLFTFDGRLYLQFRYNKNRTSDALIEAYFNRLVDIVSRSAQDA